MRHAVKQFCSVISKQMQSTSHLMLLITV